MHALRLVQRTSQILVVEDDAAVQSALDEWFSREGYDVVVANNGAEAIEMLEADLVPCCVLVDLLMPGLVGHELLQYLEEEPYKDIPVAIITGSPHLAPTGYPMFAKPLDMQALLDFVSARCPVRIE